MALGLRKNAKVDLLSKVPLFAGLSKNQLGQLATVADEIDFPAGKILIHEGDSGREFFVVLEGEAEIRRKGRKLETLRKGEFFGEIALVSKVPRVATVTSVSPMRVLVIRGQEFDALLKRVPVIALRVLEAVADRLPRADF